MRGVVDDVAANELHLYTINDVTLYRQQHLPIIQNLLRKIKAGTFKPELAVKLFKYLADHAAANYEREYGGKFNVPTRLRTAELLLQDFMNEQQSGGYELI